jgi:hypothetical protein
MNKIPIGCVAFKTFLREKAALSCIHCCRHTVYCGAKSPWQNNLLKKIAVFNDMRFKVFTIVKIWIVVFWVMTPSSLQGKTNISEEHILWNLHLWWCSFETLVITYKTTWHHNPKDHNLNIQWYIYQQAYQTYCKIFSTALPLLLGRLLYVANKSTALQFLQFY